MDLKKGTLINDRYLVEELLGEGGMGSVYKVKDFVENRISALKLIKEKIFSNKAIDRFKNEFKLVINLDHRNIIEVYDFDVYKKIDTYFITMEYIEGENLNRSFYDMSNKNKYDILMQISRGLNYIHSRRIVHFDIKPDNIILVRNEEKDSYQVKIMDFGLASLLEEFTGKVRGTLSYIAPEVMLKKEVDYRADLYSLGMVIYHLFSNKLPFEEFTSIKAIVRAKLEEAFIEEDEFKYLENEFLKNLIIDLCRAKKEDRILSAQQLMSYLETASEIDVKSEDKETDLNDNFNDSYYFDRSGYLKKVQDDYLNFCIRGEKRSGKLNLVIGEVGSGRTQFLKSFNTRAQLNRVPVLYLTIEKEQDTLINIFYRKIIFGLLAYLDDDRDKSDGIFNKAVNLINKKTGLFIESDTFIFNIKEVLRLVFSNLSKNLSPIIIIDNLYNFKKEDNSLFLYMLHLIVKSPIFLVVSVDEEKLNGKMIKDYEEIFYLFPSERFDITRLNKAEILEFLASYLNVTQEQVDDNLVTAVMRESGGNVSLIKSHVQFLVRNNFLLYEQNFYKYNYFSGEVYTADIHNIYISRLRALSKEEKEILIFINEGLYSCNENEVFGDLVTDNNNLNGIINSLDNLGFILREQQKDGFKKIFIRNQSIKLLIKKVFKNDSLLTFYDNLSNFYLSKKSVKRKSIVKYTYCFIRSSADIKEKIKVIETGISYCRTNFKEIYLREFLEFYLDSFEIAEGKKVLILKELYMLLIWDKQQEKAIIYYNEVIDILQKKKNQIENSENTTEICDDLSEVYSDSAYFNSSLISTEKRVSYLQQALLYYSNHLDNRSNDFINNVNIIIQIYFRSGEIDKCPIIIDEILEKYKGVISDEIVIKLNARKWFFSYADELKKSDIYRNLVEIFYSLEADNIVPGEEEVAIVIVLLNQIVLNKTHFPLKTAETYIKISDRKTDKISEIALYYIYGKFLEKYGKLEESVEAYNKLENIIESYKGIYGILAVIIDKIDVLNRFKADSKIIEANLEKAFSIANRLDDKTSLLKLHSIKIKYLISRGEFREVDLNIKYALNYISYVESFRVIKQFYIESFFYFYTIKDSEGFYELADKINTDTLVKHKDNLDTFNEDISMFKSLFTLPNTENLEIHERLLRDTKDKKLKLILLIKYLNCAWSKYKPVKADFILNQSKILLNKFNDDPVSQSYIKTIIHLLNEEYKNSYNEVFSLVKINFNNGFIFDCYYPILSSLLYFKNISLYKNALYYEEKIEKLIKKLQTQIAYEKRYNFTNKYNIY